MNLTPAEAAAKLREAREAAERVLRLVPESPTDRDYDYCGNAIGNPYYKLENYECLEVRKVAEAYLEQNPADDEEALSEAWLKEQGFEQSGAFWDLVVPNIAGYPTKVSVMPNGGEWALFLIQSDWIGDSDEADWGDSSCVQVNRITTRRALRCLLRGMGHDRKGKR